MFAAVSALRGRRVVLASTSPRRKQLLEQLGVRGFDVIPSTFDESLDKALFAAPADYVLATARAKAREVATRLRAQRSDAEPFDVLIAADTIVAVDSVVLEKPRDVAHARDMLGALSGRQHTVYTAVVVLAAGGTVEETAVEATRVEFDVLSDDDIAAYVASGEPMDKAGGYGIQALGAAFVRRIEGCYYNVMGLPLHRLCRLLTAVLERG